MASEVVPVKSVLHRSCPTSVNEKNGSTHKSSTYLYFDKAFQIWSGCRELVDGGVGIANDVFPKHKSGEQSWYERSLTKYSDHVGGLDSLIDLPRNDRLLLLADYVREQFESYKSHERVDVRLSTGVVPFLTEAMLGLLIQKIYIHYPNNPIKSVNDAREMLDFARQYHHSVLGVNDNQELHASASAAGGILHADMLAWYLQSHPKARVQVDGLIKPDLREIELIGSGFTPTVVRGIDQLVSSYTGCKRKRECIVKNPIPLTSKNKNMVVWSRGDDRCVVLPYKV